MTTTGETTNTGLQGPSSRAFRGLATLAVAAGFVAVSAFAIGRLSIRRLKIRNASLKSLDIQDVNIKRLRVADLIVTNSLRAPGNGGGRRKQ
jgi:hypothetical protein